MMERIILASASPRRQELFEQMGLPFEIHPQDVDETFTGRKPEEEAIYLAEKKIKSFIDSEEEAKSMWALGADTFVSAKGILIGKPAEKSDAENMLNLLSGCEHQVVTGLALNVPYIGIRTACCITKVRFSALTQDEISWYLDLSEWEGAAGAYRIQGRGGMLIEGITGSYSNVMGLPINTFYGMLRANNYNFRS